MKIKLSFLVLFSAMLGSIFLFTQIVKSVGSDIVINEICPTSCADSNKHQWVEIINQGNTTVDITGWKFWEEQTNHSLKFNSSSPMQDYLIQPGEYCAIAEDDQTFILDYPGFAGHIFDSSWSTLNKSGEEIGLKSDNNTFVDGLFTYISTTVHSIEKISVSSSSSDITNWKENPSGNTVGQINYWTSYVPPSPPPPALVNQNPIAVINAPTSTEVGTTTEFDGGDSSDPDGIIVGYKWTIGGGIFGIGVTSSYVFTTSGSYIIGLLITDNQGASVSTSVDIIANSITTTATITTSTSPEAVSPTGGQAPLAETFPALFINEFLPDPSTSSEHEWIELYNPTTSSVDLNGWTLSDSTGVRSSPTGTIIAEGFFVVEMSNVLNNTGDTITLKNPLSEISDSVVYGTSTLKAPAKSNSVARSINGAGSWQETTTITKNLANIITEPSHPSVSSGQGGSGSPASQVNLFSTNLNSTGQIIINEILPNPKGSDTENEFIELKNIGTSIIDLRDWILNDASASKFKIKDSFILPGGFIVFKRSATNISLNNSGGDEVKLYNPAGSLIDSVKYTGTTGEDESYARKQDNIWGWTTKLTPGAENIFVNKNLPPVVSIVYPIEAEVGETAVFDASDTYDPENDNLNFVWTIGEEKKSGEILKYVFDRAGDRVINLIIDDGKGNKVEKKFKISVVRIEVSDEEGIRNMNSTELRNETVKVVTVKKSGQSYRPVIPTTLDKIRDMEIGNRVRVIGIVTVEPGLLGSQYFYIVNMGSGSTSSPQAGVQVYSNKKDFPDLKVGDKVQITGDLSESYGERRIKTKTKIDIKKIGTGGVFNPQIVEISEIGEDNEGTLVQVQGEVTEAKSAYLYLDDGTEEIKIAFKKGIGILGTDYVVGEHVQLIGIVGQTKSGYQIMPRSGVDIVKIAEALLFQSTSSSTNSANVAETYLTATAGGLTSILIGLFAKARGRLAWGAVKKVGSVALKLVKRNPKV